MDKSIKLKVPATTANVGSGFDVMGIALNLYNFIEIKESNKTTINFDKNIKVSSGKNNLIYKSIERIFNEQNLKTPDFEINVSINIPTSRGLGSSSSAIIGGLVAANYFCGQKFSKNEILNFANDIEGHPDNVAPCLLGGIVSSVVENKKVFSCNINTDLDLSFVVIIPEFELPTSESRKVLPKTINFSDAIFNMSRLSFLINGFYKNDLKMIEIGLKDRLHEQYRGKLIKGFDEIKNIALENGAIGSVLSGAGPTILAVCRNNPDEIGNFMKNKWIELGVKSDYKILKIDYEGIKII
ncbi:MAG: homoserine kinase [Candidatus Sericytochromatia bacterium]|nr:homoserine kinase [Candidatus Sericytochromatia bacterium]